MAAVPSGVFEPRCTLCMGNETIVCLPSLSSERFGPSMLIGSAEG